MGRVCPARRGAGGGAGTLGAMSRRSALALAALVAMGAAAVAPAAAAGPEVMVSPAGDHDPGSTITVSNAPGSVCPETNDPNVSVDIVTSANGLVAGPYNTTVQSGQFAVQVPLAPDLAPGNYLARASCFAGASASPSKTYEPAPFTVRLQSPGDPIVQPDHAVPGDIVQVGSGTAKCKPPRGATSPRVRASIVDASGNTRAEAEGSVFGDGSWAVKVRVTEIDPQVGRVTAVCLARVGAPAPFARYGQTTFTIVAPAPASTTTTVPAPTTTPAPGGTAAPATTTTVPAPTTTLGPVPALPGFGDSLPPTPVPTPIVAEPAYTG